MPREGSGVPSALLLPCVVSTGTGAGMGRCLPSLSRAVPPTALCFTGRDSTRIGPSGRGWRSLGGQQHFPGQSCQSCEAREQLDEHSR